MARRAYAEAATPPEWRAAQRVAKLIYEERLSEFTIADVSKRERHGLRSKAEVTPALDVLVEVGWLVCEKPGSGAKGGRPRTDYRTNPRLWERQ